MTANLLLQDRFSRFLHFSRFTYFSRFTHFFKGKRAVLMIVASALIAACANTETSRTISKSDVPPPTFSDEAEFRLSDMMVGTFRTRIDDVDNNFVDRRIALPEFGARIGETDSAWLYYQINRGVDNQVYRQRVIQLKPVNANTVTQLAWTLNTPEDFVDLWDKPDMQALLSKADMTASFNAGCEQTWVLKGEVWHGDVDPKTCQIESKRRNKKIAIGARAQLSAETLLQAESGYELDGTWLWGSKADEFIKLDRVR